MKEFPDILKDQNANERNGVFRECLFNLNYSEIKKENIHSIVRIYENSKLPEIRRKCLILLYNLNYSELADFFGKSIRRERKLTLKILSIRGFAQFASEESISKVIRNISIQLQKIMISTPYDYRTLETLKGENALPYLVERYHYSALNKFEIEVNELYQGLPTEFQNIFKIDKEGNTISNPNAKNEMANFFKRNEKTRPNT